MAVVLIALLVLGGVLFTFSSFNVASVRVDRERASNEALAMAKDALVAYAVVDPVRPGQLPCPDVNNDGEAKIGEDFNAATGACNSLTGRLPWITLGLPDLRDDSGEPLWYAVSGDFRAGNTGVALNSDTAYRAGHVSLTLAGTTLASNLAAIVFAPGQALQRFDGTSQVRSCTVGTNCDANLKCLTTPASATPKCNPANFLDISSGVDNADANQSFVSAPKSANFNDQLVPIFSDDIMRLVERRAARELARRLRDHYDTWQAPPAVAGIAYTSFKGFYPWAAPLNDPSVVAAGVNNTTSGQLPLAASSVVWNSANAPPIIGSCSGVNTTQIQCSALVALPLLVTFSGSVRNVGTAFIDPPNASHVTVTGGAVIGTPTVTWSLNPGAQTLDFTWTGLVGVAVTITARVPDASAWTTSSWLTTNNWHQNALYAVSSGFAISQLPPNTCGGAGPVCITVANTAAPNDDKHAVVTMTGRALALAGQNYPRPASTPASVGEFFEGLNADLDFTQFESNARTATFNDTPVAVRP